MFSTGSSFFGTASALKEQSSLRESERNRMRQMSIRRETQSIGPKTNIYTHQYTSDPTLAWEMLKENRPVKPVRQMSLNTPIKPDHVRFVCIGCTHGVKINPSSIPPGDVLLIAGDFTTCGLPTEVYSFNKLLGRLKHSYKVIIAGNHECTFDDTFLRSSKREVGAKELALRQALQASLTSTKIASSKSLITNAIYLEDSVIELFGITIYGTPWQPRFDNWAFNLTRGQALLEKWNQIPTAVDVLLTHTPPLGHGDMLRDGQRMGCVELLNSVCKRIKPKYHVFSHIHEGTK
ncbi:Ser/Thr phosphatase family protein [Dictyocaulus viviparus]|uniref:Ser/Thr phosphatase family protein n=1 Tax=Dictyocaulus viviparus TaxID=29172 RepID=A0A0D8XZ75_DICVI|nr:Ser/Thr phosphatase family protein [Dictyocaulus viviparus]